MIPVNMYQNSQLPKLAATLPKTAEKSKDCRTQKIQAAAEKQPALRKNSYSIRGHPPTRSILFLSVCLQTENRMNFRQHFVRRSISTHRKEFQYSKKTGGVFCIKKHRRHLCFHTLCRTNCKRTFVRSAIYTLPGRKEHVKQNNTGKQKRKTDCNFC